MNRLQETPELGRRWLRGVVVCCGLMALWMSTAACHGDREPLEGDASGYEHHARGCADDFSASVHHTDDAGHDADTTHFIEPGRLSVLPDRISFEWFSIGREDVQLVLLRNNGTGPLCISSVEIQPSPTPNTSSAAFSKGAGWFDSVELAPNEDVLISIVFRPTERVRYAGVLAVTSNDPRFARSGGVLQLPIETPPLTPHIWVQEIIDFPRVAAGTTASQTYAVTNIGDAPLIIEDIRMRGSADFSISFPDEDAPDDEVGRDASDWKTPLQPDESFPIRVTFSPTHADPQTAEIVFESDDPQQPVYKVLLSGNADWPCIEVTDEGGINFGLSSIGQTSSRTITLTNCSLNAELRVDSISLADDGGGVFRVREDSLPGGFPDRSFAIPARETANFVLAYTPTGEEDNAGVLNIRNNDPRKRNLNVPINGRGSLTACPVAVAQGRVEGTNQEGTNISAQPLKHVQLTGTASADPNGAPVTYEWTVISRPQGSRSFLMPDNTVAEPRLWLDLAGTYEIELVVYNGSGLASCEPAVVTVQAVPEEDIYIELNWHAEAVGEARPGRGTDLDLHYRHPQGQWNQAPYDVFWQNRRANWGTQSNPSIAALLIDDLHGIAPEVIGHSNPEPGLTYLVGAHYFADNGFGPADATVRVYIRGELQYELRDRRLPGTGYFWFIGAIQWPVGNVIPRNEVRVGFP
jgi:hypothetical protein